MLVNKNENGALLYAIKKFGFIRGKKALQKIMYFANLKDHLYSFQWNKLGPYSEELNYAFDDAVAEGIIEVKPQDPKEDQQFYISLSEQGLDLLNSITLESATKSAIEFAYKILNGKDYRDMELLAYTHFILVNDDHKNDPKFILEIIRTLKPNEEINLKHVTNAITELSKFKLA